MKIRGTPVISIGVLMYIVVIIVFWCLLPCVAAGQRTDLFFRGGHSEEVVDIAWSPDGQMLVSRNSYGRIMLWDGTNGELLGALPGSFPDHCKLLITWGQQGPRLITVDSGTIMVWDAAHGQVLHRLSVPGDERWSAALSPDGQRLASGGKDALVRVWDITCNQLLHTLAGHEDEVSLIQWSPDGQRLVSVSRDRRINLWDAATGQLLHTLSANEDEISAIEWSPDGQRLVSTSHDRTMRVWDAVNGNLLWTFRGE